MNSLSSVDNAGIVSTIAKIDVGNATAVEFTITTGKHGATIQNTGSNLCWVGGSDVNPTNLDGAKLFPSQSITFQNVQSNFSIFFLCESGATTTLGGYEF